MLAAVDRGSFSAKDEARVRDLISEGHESIAMPRQLARQTTPGDQSVRCLRFKTVQVDAGFCWGTSSRLSETPCLLYKKNVGAGGRFERVESKSVQPNSNLGFVRTVKVCVAQCSAIAIGKKKPRRRIGGVGKIYKQRMFDRWSVETCHFSSSVTHVTTIAIYVPDGGLVWEANKSPPHCRKCLPNRLLLGEKCSRTLYVQNLKRRIFALFIDR